MDSISEPRPQGYVPPRGRWERAICRALFQRMLNQKRIRVILDDDESDAVPGSSAEFIVAAPRLWATMKLMFAPDLFVGESYVAGDWYLPKGNLSNFLLAIELDAKGPFRAYYNFVSGLRGIRFYLSQFLLNRSYTRRVKQHYELDSRIYELILDDEMLYTCAFFSEEAKTLAEAQQEKLNTTLRRLSLPLGPVRVLDIGCGWGGMARAIVRNRSHAEVCGLSISQNQLDWARAKDARSLLGDQIARVEYRLEDYVDHERSDYYDAISVIGMIEHVGLGGYDEFFAKCQAFLKRGGSVVVHTIVSPLPAVPTNDWIDRHIFTGGYAPALSELITAAERREFRISGVHVHAPSNYRRTIECWLANLLRNVPEIREYLAKSGSADTEIDKFLRTWKFYLSGVRNMFADEREHPHQVVQLSLQKL